MLLQSTRKLLLQSQQNRTLFSAASAWRKNSATSPCSNVILNHTHFSWKGSFSVCVPQNLSQKSCPWYYSTRFLSTTPTASAVAPTSAVDVLGIGGQKWSLMNASKYNMIIHEALENGITTLEAGLGGEAALAQAIRLYLQQNNEYSKTIQVMLRVGYRTVQVPKDGDDPNDGDQATPSAAATTTATTTLSFPHDVVVEQQETSKVLHNLGHKYLDAELQNSPLTKLQQEYPQNISLTVMIHNPELQAISLDHDSKQHVYSTEERQFHIRQVLVKAFQHLQESNLVAAFGVTSNGLGLPPEHPLYLNKDTVLSAAQQVFQQHPEGFKFQVVEVPANLLETQGIMTAREIKHAVSSSQEEFGDLPSTLQVYAMRPLTCYPDRGTGTGHPFVLADYLLPTNSVSVDSDATNSTTGTKPTMKWSNEMESPPQVYQVALKTAMQHFDAEDLVQAKLDGKELTAEERETLDGCKLLHSLLHDVDHGLDKMRSFTAHEDDLYQKIIPLIHDTFESYDEDTGVVLESFFAAYSLAVRYAIAKNTRRLLTHGEDGSNIPVHADLPEDMRLQEYAMRFLLKQDTFDKIIVGCSEPEHVLDEVDIVTRFIDDKHAQEEKENVETTDNE